jgi:hypothetical protein
MSKPHGGVFLKIGRNLFRPIFIFIQSPIFQRTYVVCLPKKESTFKIYKFFGKLEKKITSYGLISFRVLSHDVPQIRFSKFSLS